MLLSRRWSQAHLGAARVRAIAVDSTRQLRRGAEVRSDGLPLTVPVGRGLLGRVVDLRGNPLDGGPPISPAAPSPASRRLRPLGSAVPGREVYQTGIKVIDLFCPFLHGGRAAVFGGAGVGKTVVLTEFIHNAVDAVQGRGGVRRHRRALARGPRAVERDEAARRAWTERRWSSAR